MGNNLTTIDSSLFINIQRPLALFLSNHDDRDGNPWECETLCWLKQEEAAGTILLVPEYDESFHPKCTDGSWESIQCSQGKQWVQGFVEQLWCDQCQMRPLCQHNGYIIGINLKRIGEYSIWGGLSFISLEAKGRKNIFLTDTFWKARYLPKSNKWFNWYSNWNLHRTWNHPEILIIHILINWDSPKGSWGNSPNSVFTQPARNLSADAQSCTVVKK